MALSPEACRELLRYLDMVVEIVRGLRKALSHLNNGRTADAKSELTRTIQADTEADNVRREIAEKLPQLVEEPQLREEILRLLRMLDRVSEWTKESARYLDVLPYLDLPQEIKEGVEELARLALEGAEKLGLALRALAEGDRERCLEYCREVEDVEERADQAIHSSRKNLIAYGPRLQNPSAVVLLRDFLEALENITDYEEDAADVLRLIALRLG